MIMIEIKLIPDGGSEVPYEVTDHRLLANKLKEVDVPDYSPAPSWQDVERVIPSSGKYIKLRINGSLDDYDESALDAFVNAVTSGNDIKEHPDGWVEISDNDRP